MQVALIKMHRAMTTIFSNLLYCFRVYIWTLTSSGNL